MAASFLCDDKEATRLLSSEACSAINELPVNHGHPDHAGALWDLSGSFGRVEHVSSLALDGGVVLPHVIQLTPAPVENAGSIGGGAPRVGMSNSLVRLPSGLPAGQTYLCFIMYRNVPTEQQASGCDVQLSVGELVSLIPLDFEHFQASRLNYRPADCEWRVLAVGFTKQAGGPPLYLRINTSSGRTAGLQVTMPVVVEARRFILWSRGMADVAGVPPAAQPPVAPPGDVRVHVVVAFPIKGLAEHLRQSVKAQLEAQGRSDVLVLDSDCQYYLKRNHRFNGEEASFYEEATDCSKLALKGLPRLLEELRWWVRAKHPGIRHVVLVSPSLVVAGHQPALLDCFSSLTVATVDAMEANRRLHINTSTVKDTKGMQCFLTDHLGALHAAAMRSRLGPRHYRVVCLGRGRDRTGLMAVLNTRPGGKVSLLQERREEHGRAILEQVDGLPLGQPGWPIDDRHMMKRMLGEDQQAIWRDEWRGMNKDVGDMARGLAIEVAAWLVRCVGEGRLAPPDDHRWMDELARMVCMTREVLFDLPFRVRLYTSLRLLGFDKISPDPAFLHTMIDAATAALHAGHHDALAALLGLLLELLETVDDGEVNIVAILRSSPAAASLLERVIISGSIEPSGPTSLPHDHPGVLAAVGLLVRLGNVLHCKPGPRTASGRQQLAELLEERPQLLGPVYMWLGRLTAASASSSGNVLRETLSCLIDLFNQRHGFSRLMVRGLTPACVWASANVAKVTLGAESCSGSTQRMAVALLQMMTATCWDPRAIHHGAGPSYELLADEALYEALRAAVVPTCTEDGDGVALKAIEVLRNILRERKAVRVARQAAEEQQQGEAAPEEEVGAGVPEAVDGAGGQREGAPAPAGQPEVVQGVEEGKGAEDEEINREGEEEGELAQGLQPEDDAGNALLQTLTTAELAARVEARVVRYYAAQRMLRHYNADLDDAAAAVAEDLGEQERLQRCLAEQVQAREEQQRLAEKAEAEAEEVWQRLRDAEARLALAERQARRAAAGREDAVGGAAVVSQEGRQATEAEVSVLRELALDLQLQGLDEAVRGRARQAFARYEGYTEDRQPIDDPAKAREVIETVRLVTEVRCQPAMGFQPLPLVELLGPAQYSSPEQFLPEVLQNFGDCTYPAGHGHVEITLGADAIMLSADEQGFSAADVRAVCSMGDSTKRMRADQTGRMGIGFKSVFLVTHRPLVLSGQDQSGPSLAMAFGTSDRPPEPLELLMPQVASESEVPADLRQAKAELEAASGRRYTHLVLPIRPDLSPAELRQLLWSSAYDRHTLLTLDRIRQVRIRRLPAAEGEAEEVQTFSREELVEGGQPGGGREVLLRSSDGSVRRMMVFDVPVPELEEEAARYHRRPALRFAFPLGAATSQQAEGAGDVGRPTFPVYASLPVAEPVALPFVLQADWDVTTNRDRIKASHPWNAAIFAQLAPALLRLFANEAFQNEGGPRIADSLPLREEMRGRGRQAVPGRWLEFVRAVQEGVRDAGLLLHQQGPEGSQWVADEHMQQLVPSSLWASVGISLLPSSSSASSPELLQLLGVRQLGWAELARLLAHAEQAGHEEDELGRWLEGLRGRRFEPVFAYLSATHATSQISRLAASGRQDQATQGALDRFRECWSKLCIFRDAATGEYRCFDPRRLALLQPRDGHDADLCRVLVAAGVPVLAHGASEAERQLHSALGLQPATASHVADVVLRVSCATLMEEEAAAVDDERYWGHQRILAHLLETRAVLPSDARLRQVWLRCRASRGADGARRCKRVNEVSLPSVLGHVLPAEAVEAGFYMAEGFGESATWQGCSSMDLEALLVRLGCGLPRWEGRVEVDVSGLFGRDVSDVLEVGPYSGLASRLLVQTTHGLLPPSDAFMPHVVLGDEELPVVRLDPAIPASACMPGQPLYAALTRIGVQRMPTARYFLRSIHRVATAESAAELGGLPAVHGLAVEGSLCRLKLRLVDRLLRCLREQGPEEARRVAAGVDEELELPCEGAEGEDEAVGVSCLFLLDAVQEMGLAEPVRAALPVVVDLLGGARAASQGNVVYLHHRPILEALGAQTALEAHHVAEAIDELVWSASQDRDGVVGLQERVMVLYRCLDHMLGEMEGGDEEGVAALVSRVRLLVERGAFVQAASCSLPIADPFKQLLGELRGGKELARVSPSLLELSRLLSCCARDEARFGGQVACDLPNRVRNEFMYARALSDAINQELGQAGPLRVELALVADFAVRHKDMPQVTAKGKASAIEPAFVLFKGHRLAVTVSEEGRAVLELEEQEGPTSCAVGLLRVSLTDHGKHHQDGDLSMIFSQRLHAALTALLESHQPGAMTTVQAREAAADIVKAVHRRLPGAIMAESLTAFGMPEQSLALPYDALVLPRPGDDMQQYQSLRWWQPGQARGAGEDELGERKGGELTREQYERVQELGGQAELYAHELFERMPEVQDYSPEACWVSESKALVMERGADMGTVDEAAGYDFRLRINGRTVLVEVKGSAGRAADARVLMYQNQLDRMREVMEGRGGADAYLVMVVGNVGRQGTEHRFFTPEQVQEQRTTQRLCKVAGAGHDDVIAALEGAAAQRQAQGQPARYHQQHHHPQQREEGYVRGSGARQYPERQPRGRDEEEERGSTRGGPAAGRYEASHRRHQQHPQEQQRPWRPSEEQQMGSGSSWQQQPPRRDRPDHDSSDGSEASSCGGGGRDWRDGRRSSFGDGGEASGSWRKGGAGQGSREPEERRERRRDGCVAGCRNGSSCRAKWEGWCRFIHADQQCPGCGLRGGH